MGCAQLQQAGVDSMWDMCFAAACVPIQAVLSNSWMPDVPEPMPKKPDCGCSSVTYSLQVTSSCRG
jgi:hypothetical protein